MPGFLQRLKQRKLVQWALAYVAFAFALLQGVDIVAQQFGWPEVLQRGITLTLALGFFVMLLLAWYHGELGEQSVRGSELMLLALLLAVGGGLLWRFARVAAPAPVAPATQASEVKPADWPPASVVIPDRSIAVLPLACEGRDDGDRVFADGLSEDLITALSQYAGLKVIGRNSAFQFRDSREDSASIGRKLGVAHLLEGSVRRAGDEVRISASLVRAADGSTLWSQHYDKPYKDLFSLQDDITHAVVSVLRVKLSDVPGAVLQTERPPNGNPDAWQAYLEGGRLFEEPSVENFQASVEAYRAAIRLDPRYAAAYAGVARTRISMAAGGLSGEAAQRAFAEAGRAVDKALALDPALSNAHMVRAYLYSVSNFDWPVVDAELRRAIQLAPYSAGAKVFYGQYQAVLGNLPQAIELVRAGLVNDPRNARYRKLLLSNLITAGRLDEARRELRVISDLDPEYPQAYALARMAFRSGDGRAALALLRGTRDTDQAPSNLELLALQLGDDRAAADLGLQSLLARQDERNMAYGIARAYALRHDPDQMFAWLERTWERRDPVINELLADPVLAPYRQDPRFTALCRAMRLPVQGCRLPDASAGSGMAAAAEGRPVRHFR